MQQFLHIVSEGIAYGEKLLPHGYFEKELWSWFVVLDIQNKSVILMSLQRKLCDPCLGVDVHLDQVKKSYLTCTCFSAASTSPGVSSCQGWCERLLFSYVLVAFALVTPSTSPLPFHEACYLMMPLWSTLSNTVISRMVKRWTTYG